MKKIIILCFSIIITIPTYSQLVDDGLIGYWSFNGSASDSAANNWHGIVYGATLTTDRHNNQTKAYELGAGTRIEIPNVIRNTKAMALSIWCYPTTVDNNYRWLVNQRNNGNGDQFQIAFNNQTTNLVVFESAANPFILSGSPLQPNSWNHIVFQTDGTTNGILEGWINNVYQGSVNLTSDINFDIMEKIKIGVAGWSNTYGQYHGKVDDFMLLNRKLTSYEVESLFNYDENLVTQSLWQENITNIYRLGKVSVNISQVPDGYDFAVQGKTITEEVKVALVTNWPDFVFRNNYELRTLQEVESHINENGHLAEIPSEAEVIANGINLGEMDAKLLLKIEELTLYLIQQNKENQEQRKLIEELQKEVSALKNE